MQLLNKASASRTLAHTWYLYPLVSVIITFLWMWGFQAFHQPTTHQSLEIFFAAEVNNDSFLRNIMKNYDKEVLREITPSYRLPTATGYAAKLQLAINNADLLILDEKTMMDFNEHHENFFVEFSSYIKETYLDDGETYYTYNEKSYGLKLKDKNYDHWLKEYITFDEEQDYYIALGLASKNLGKVLDEKNAPYDNALTILKYFLHERL